jgi:calpain-7
MFGSFGFYDSEMITPSLLCQSLYLYSLGKTAEALQYAKAACQRYDASLESCESRSQLEKDLRQSLDLALAVYDGIKQDREVLNPSTKLAYLSSKIFSYVFYPWIDPCLPDDNDGPFTDPDGYLPLSKSQMEKVPKWRRLTELCGSHQSVTGMSQSALEDCSVVASLISICALEDRTHNYILRQNIFPLNDNCPQSATGRYTLKMFVNGTARAVVIDDFLPVSATGDPLFVKSAALWPPLVEKAYMKVMGGYDFPGSHSAADTYALTGWIPEYVLLRDYFESTSTSKSGLWDHIYKGWSQGNLVICMGTAPLAKEEADALGLVGDHDYAVLELDPNSHTMVIINPWKGGEQMSMDFDSACARFETMYLNWNPGLFTTHLNTHFLYSLEAAQQTKLTRSYVSCPQYTITNSSEEPATTNILVVRHIIDRSPPGYLSLIVYNSCTRVQAPFGQPVAKSAARNTSHNSVQVVIPPNCSYTVTVVFEASSEQISTPRFTLSAYSTTTNVALKKAPNEFPHRATVRDRWTKGSSGGNWVLGSYPENPQIKVTLRQKGRLKLYLLSEVDKPINVQLLWGGTHIKSVSDRDVICSSGKYHTGWCLAQVRDLEPGDYTAVVSTYDKGTTGTFSLIAESSSAVSVTKLVAENTTLFTRTTTRTWNGSNQQQILFSVPRSCSVSADVDLVDETPGSTGTTSYRPNFRLSIFDADRMVASSGAFSDSSRPLGLSYDCEGDKIYVCLIERMEAGHGSFGVGFHCEVPVNVRDRG